MKIGTRLYSVHAVDSRQTVVQQNSVQSLHQHRYALKQEAGLSSLAQSRRDPPTQIIQEVAG